MKKPVRTTRRGPNCFMKYPDRNMPASMGTSGADITTPIPASPIPRSLRMTARKAMVEWERKTRKVADAMRR